MASCSAAEAFIVIRHCRPFIGIRELGQEGRHRDRVGGGGAFQVFKASPWKSVCQTGSISAEYLVCTSLLAR